MFVVATEALFEIVVGDCGRIGDLIEFLIEGLGAPLFEVGPVDCGHTKNGKFGLMK